jgi:hypothetical protein
MSQKNILGLIRRIVVVSALAVSAADAGVITLSFTGSYVTFGPPAFGELFSGTPIPYSYQLTYDTSLDIFPQFVAAGTAVVSGGCPGNVCTTTDAWYGYHKSGLVSASLTFGTHTWSAADINASLPLGGAFLDYLWFDTDIDLATPTRSLIRFSDAAGSLELGRVATGGGSVFLLPLSSVHDSLTGGEAGSLSVLPMTISSTGFSNPSSVPEPSTLVLLGIGVCGLSVLRRRSEARA